MAITFACFPSSLQLFFLKHHIITSTSWTHTQKHQLICIQVLWSLNRKVLQPKICSAKWNKKALEVVVLFITIYKKVSVRHTKSHITSVSPFPVSWNTPVFCAVSKWAFSALFPILTVLCQAVYVIVLASFSVILYWRTAIWSLCDKANALSHFMCTLFNATSISTHWTVSLLHFIFITKTLNGKAYSVFVSSLDTEKNQV